MAKISLTAPGISLELSKLELLLLLAVLLAASLLLSVFNTILVNIGNKTWLNHGYYKL